MPTRQSQSQPYTGKDRRKPSPEQIELARLERLVEEFVIASKSMVESDHKKVEMIHDFLFVGQPTADPPVPPFVTMVTSEIASNKSSTNRIGSAIGRVMWTIVSLALGAAGWFIGTTLIHVLTHSQ